MKDYASFSRNKTIQTEKARADQVKNNAGGYVFALDKWGQLDRFLILGSEGGTYYVSGRELTKQNAHNVLACLSENGPKVVERVVEISQAGRAPKNDPALFVLALAASDASLRTRLAALDALPQVARIGTHLFHFAEFVNKQRGWGRGLRRAIGNWYVEKNDSNLAYQLLKYQQRDGWSHRDLLRLAHPVPMSATQNMLFNYAVKGSLEGNNNLPAIVYAFEEAKTASANRVIELIRQHNLSREMIPTELLNRVDVWEALLEKMPLEAMVRNLGKMSSVGLIAPMNQASKTIAKRLQDVRLIKQARLHPLAILVAMETYRQGHGLKGSLSWSVNQQVLNALDSAFYLAFDAVEPTGKNFAFGIDISGSMSWEESRIANTPIYAREAAAAMAMVNLRVEENTWVGAFTTIWKEVNLTKSMRLDDVVKEINRHSAGGTDAALPIQAALARKIPVDVFEVITDNDTWHGTQHVFEALREYRQKMGIPAKLVVVAMTSTGFTIADPKDAGMLDVVGFDTATPAVISDFARS